MPFCPWLRNENHGPAEDGAWRRVTRSSATVDAFLFGCRSFRRFLSNFSSPNLDSIGVQ
jgi:hypothetical protein